MSTLDVHAEIVKLARVLGTEPSKLAYFHHASAPDIRRVREATQEMLFEGDRPLFRRLAAASILLPERLTAHVAQHVFGTLLVGRIAGEMPADRAVAITERMDVVFVASVCLELDPRSVREILRQMPIGIVRAVGLELVSRREYITMGMLVGHVTEAAIAHVMEGIADEEHLMRIGPFIEAKDQISKLMSFLSDERLRRCIKIAQDESKHLWGEALSLMEHAEPAMARKLGDMMAEEGDAALTRLLERTQEQDLWGNLLPVIAHMSPEKQMRLVHLDALAEPEVLKSLFRCAEEDDLWRCVLPIIAGMTDAQRDAAARGADPAKLVRLLRAAERARLVPRLLRIADRFTEVELAQVASIVAAMPAELHDGFADEVDRAGLWEPLFDVARTLPEGARATLAETVQRVASKRPELLTKLADIAEARGLGDLVSAARAAVA